jgi:hypothetical protein
VPVTVKSDPSAAIELQRIGFLKTSSRVLGEHPGFVRLSTGVGNTGNTTTDLFSPTGMVLSQLSFRVFPSAPFLIVMI